LIERMRLRFPVLLLVATAVAALGASSPAQAHRSPKKAIWGPAYVDGVSQFPRYRDLGATIYEAQLPWAEIAPERRPGHARDPQDPAYRWPVDVTRAVADARRYGMRVALTVIGAPGWANGGRPWNWVPSSDRDFADFAYAASRHYPSVRLWMIWGEPSRSHNFQPFTRAPPDTALTPEQATAPRRYARLLDAAYGSLKQASRLNRVIGGMTYTAGDISTWQWIRYMRLPGGRRPRLDLYGHNPFSGRRPDLRRPPSCCGGADFSDLERLRRAVDRELGRPGLRSIPLFLSEFTLPTDVDSDFDFHVTPAAQAAWIRSALSIVRRASWIAALGWINLYDERPRPDGQPVSHGGLLYANGRPKPGYLAFKSG
jgi:hypothetical protein